MNYFLKTSVSQPVCGGIFSVVCVKKQYYFSLFTLRCATELIFTKLVCRELKKVENHYFKHTKTSKCD